MPGKSRQETGLQDFRELVGDLQQYLRYQQRLGISHVQVSDASVKTMNAWGTPDWKQHRFVSQGPANARIVLVDGRGGFYQGKSGRLLVKILGAMHLTPEQVLICNTADTARFRACVRDAKPEAIVALGREAVSCLLETDSPLETVQGQFHTFCGVRVMPTRHPEELIRDPGLKRGVWEDMQKVMAAAGLGHGR